MHEALTRAAVRAAVQQGAALEASGARLSVLQRIRQRHAMAAAAATAGIGGASEDGMQQQQQHDGRGGSDAWRAATSCGLSTTPLSSTRATSARPRQIATDDLEAAGDRVFDA